jgi:hypothetical protein
MFNLSSTRNLRRGLLAASTALVAVALPSLAGSASAAPSPPRALQILHFYSEFESQTFMTASGKLFNPSPKDPPVPGDIIDGTNLDYVGNHLHHAASWTASDHEWCVLGTDLDVVCQAQVAIGGSMILAEGNLGKVTASTSTSRFEVTEGTGVFKGVTGTIVAVNIDPASQTSTSDVTITLHRS